MTENDKTALFVGVLELNVAVLFGIDAVWQGRAGPKREGCEADVGLRSTLQWLPTG